MIVKILTAIDNQGYKSKPKGAEIGTIRNKLAGKAAHHEVTIEQLAGLIAHGHTIQGALLEDKTSPEDPRNTDERFITQQAFIIDIDNKYKDKATGRELKTPRAIESPEEIKAIAAGAGLQPCIIAESFTSGTADDNGQPVKKYHAIFAADKPIKDVKQSRRILNGLIDLYNRGEQDKPPADRACKDPARIIFGTTPDKDIFVNSAVNSIETLLNCFPEPAEPEPEPAPKAKRTQSTAAKASGKTGSMSDFTKDIKENKADPDIILQMINPNNITYEQWERASAAYKLFDSHSLEVWDSWNRQFTGERADYKADLKAFKAFKGYSAGKQIHKISLHAIAEEQAPEEYNAYINGLIEQYKQTAKASRKQASPADPAGAPTQASTQAEQVEQWGDIKPFEKTVDLQPFPLETLPKVLQDYAGAVAAYNSVFPEMCILPLFSALSLCLQGKAIVRNPGTGHPEPLNLYCITIAAPGERKTSTSNLFFKPINEYEKRYNLIHRAEIEEYHIKHKILENKLNKAIQKSKEAESEREAYNLRAELTELEDNPKNPLNYTLQDVTPEALIDTLYNNKERAAIIGDEATLFKILCGAYNSKGAAGVNFDILLTSYDGEPYKVSRKNSGNIYLKSPLVTIGTMIQPQPFKQVLQNSDLNGKGLLQRFIFSCPRSNVGNIPFSAPQIPKKTAEAYSELLYKLLALPESEEPAALGFDKEATSIIEYYHYELQKKLKPGGAFSDLAEYASKQEAKVLRIAALLHLCEHSAGELITGYTAMQAVKIGVWLESQATAALEAEMMTDTERNARYLLRKLKTKLTELIKKAKGGKLKALTKSDLLRMCRKLSAEELQEALAYLDDMGALKYNEEKTSGRAKMNVIVNPAIIEFTF